MTRDTDEVRLFTLSERRNYHHAPVAPETQAKIPHKPPISSPNACSTHATPADGSWNAAPNSAVTNASGIDHMNGKIMNPKTRYVNIHFYHHP